MGEELNPARLGLRSVSEPRTRRAVTNVQYLQRAAGAFLFLIAAGSLPADFVDDNCTKDSTTCSATVIEADDPYLLVRGKGRLRFLHAPADKPVLGAVLRVGGFSPKKNATCELGPELNDDEKATLREEEDRWKMGFHVYSLSWCDPSTFIQRNSLVLEKALEEMRAGSLGESTAALANTAKVGIIAGSMGGLVTRHALSKMESEGRPHGVSLFISFDSPQLGGYLPPSIQKANAVFLAPAEFASVLLLRFPVASVVARLSGNELAAELTGMDTPAARQMLLIHHTSSRSSGPHPSFIELFNELNGYGWPGQFGMRTVAIANGSSGASNRRLQGVSLQTKRTTVSSKFFGVKYRSLITGETLWEAGVDVKFRVPLRMTLRPLTQGNSNQEILRIDFDNAELQVDDLSIIPLSAPSASQLKDLLGVPDWVPTDIIDPLIQTAVDDIDAFVDSGLEDVRPPSLVFRSDAEFGYEAGGAGLGDKYTAFYDAVGGLSLFEARGGEQKETFIPTRSALHTPGDPLEEITEEDIANSPFDQLYYHRSDTDHVQMTGRYNRWVCKEFHDLALRTFVSSVSPSKRPVAGKEFELTVRGGNFNASSTVMWNNDGVVTELATTFVDGGTLKAFVPDTLIANVTRCTDEFGCPTPSRLSIPGERLPIRISVNTTEPLLAPTSPDWAPDTAPGCKARADFQIEEVPLPTFDPPMPTSVDEISATFADDWTTGCVPMDPVVDVSGNTITVTATGDPGTCTFVVQPYTLDFNFGPLKAGDYTMVVEDVRGGVTTPIAERLFSIQNPVPTIHNVAPATAPAGSPEVTIQVTGTGYVEDDSLVYWNGEPLATAYLSSKALNAVIPPANLAQQGMFDITVQTADPNEELTSNPFTFIVTEAELRLDVLEPEIVPIDSPATAITLTGVSFHSATTVQFTRGNGTTGFLSPTLNSSTEIVVAMPASELRAAQKLLFSVMKGAETSNSLGFEVFSEEEPAPVGPITSAVVNAASFEGPITPGSLATIFGSGLAVAELQVSELPLPTDALGTQILIGGIAAPQLFLSPDQLNFQVPFELPVGDVTIQVIRDGVAGPEATVAAVASAFRAFQYVREGSEREPIVTHADASLVTPDNPAAPGETVVLYGTGVGVFTDPPATGAPAAASPLAACADSPRSFVLGDQLSEEGATPFCGLTPGFASLVQINITLPTTLPPGSAFRLGVLFPDEELVSWPLWIAP